MSGVDVVRGIGYQQAQALLAAIELLDDRALDALRVEGVDDVVDVEVFLRNRDVVQAKQIKTRREPYTWSRSEIIGVLRRWAELPAAEGASFEFLTNGRLGPSGNEVDEALVEASNGNLEPLARVLGSDVTEDVLVTLSRATLRVDQGGVGALVQRAVRQVASILPKARTKEDLREQARAAVSELFFLLFERAGESDPGTRIVTRAEIAETLGVSADQVLETRWPGRTRDRYIKQLSESELDSVVAPTLEPYSQRDATRSQLDPLALLGSSPALVVGRTGSGKSTLASWVCKEAAGSGRVTVQAHAEAYLPNRLAALVADAMADRLGEDFPSATGRQLLADSEVTVLIDGVSEIPAESREALRAELLQPVAASQGAGIVLLGRDVAALREVLPSTSTPSTFVVSPLDEDRRLEIACRTALGVESIEALEHSDSEEIRKVVAQAGIVLGDGVGNPLLFTWTLSLLSEGIPFTSRAGLYEAFMERMAERTGVSGILEATLSFGVISARLLDRGRRSADPYEWQQLVSESLDELQLRRSGLDEKSLDDKIRRSGMVSPLGFTQFVVPFHDSFADYTAGLVHARGVSPLPERLEAGDAQRVLFAGEIGGVDSKLADAASRDLPYESVRLAKYEDRVLSADSPLEIEALLHNLLPGDVGVSIILSRMDDERAIAILAGHKAESRWVDQSTALSFLQEWPGVVVSHGGPLAVAVRLWRLQVKAATEPDRGLGLSRLDSLESGIAALRAHSQRVAEMTQDMAEAVAPPAGLQELLAAIGPLGLQAVVYPAKTGIVGRQWPIKYRHIDGLDIRPAAEDGNGDTLDGTVQWGTASVESFTDRHPSQEASERVRDAFVSLTSMRWL